ncbi:hypothetical protein ACT3UJ_14610 [Halomonas sp. 86]|uniref:hypothetical protein n=1 Tax=unclassified Halomonas TaxID=2609666 RepID=UPI004034F676
MSNKNHSSSENQPLLSLSMRYRSKDLLATPQQRGADAMMVVQNKKACRVLKSTRQARTQYEAGCRFNTLNS